MLGKGNKKLGEKRKLGDKLYRSTRSDKTKYKKLRIEN
jgi:hypothetical protein